MGIFDIRSIQLAIPLNGVCPHRIPAEILVELYVLMKKKNQKKQRYIAQYFYIYIGCSETLIIAVVTTGGKTPNSFRNRKNA